MAADPSRGRFLLQQKDAGYRRFPLAYSFFGGGIEAGESARQALERELDEELPEGSRARLRSAAWSVAWSGAVPGARGGFDYTLYQVRLPAADLAAVAAAEVYEGLRAALIPAAELRGLPFVWGLEAVLPALLSEERE